MLIRRFALIVGVMYLLVGILGFLPGLLSSPPVGAPDVPIDLGYGYLLNLFPVNALHNLVHLALGLWGIFAYNNAMTARLYARVLAVFYGLLAIMGLIPVANTTFGLIPLFSNDIWLHAVTALIAAYFGFMTPEPAADDAQPGVTSTSSASPRS